MELDEVTLKKLRRKVAKGSSPALKREQVLYSALHYRSSARRSGTIQLVDDQTDFAAPAETGTAINA